MLCPQLIENHRQKNSTCVAEWIQNFNLVVQGVFEQMAFKLRRLVAGLPTPVGVRPFEGRRAGVRGDARAQRATLRRPRGDPVVPGHPV